VEVLGGGGGVDNVPVDVVAIDLRLLRVAHLKKSVILMQRHST
jgi:hypothetical protein